MDPVFFHEKAKQKWLKQQELLAQQKIIDAFAELILEEGPNTILGRMGAEAKEELTMAITNQVDDQRYFDKFNRPGLIRGEAMVDRMLDDLYAAVRNGVVEGASGNDVELHGRTIGEIAVDLVYQYHQDNDYLREEAKYNQHVWGYH